MTPEEIRKQSPDTDQTPRLPEPVEIEGKYVWPRGPNGIPVRTSSPTPPSIRRSEETEMNVVEDAHVDVLDLSNTDQLTKYRNILDGARKGHLEIVHVERHWVPEAFNWRVLIEYVAVYDEPRSSYTSNPSTSHDQILSFRSY